eukprot:SAG11_NODE_17043_length_530_cov_0.958237_1_plen_57_part_10
MRITTVAPIVDLGGRTRNVPNIYEVGRIQANENHDSFIKNSNDHPQLINFKGGTHVA